MSFSFYGTFATAVGVRDAIAKAYMPEAIRQVLNTASTACFKNPKCGGVKFEVAGHLSDDGAMAQGDLTAHIKVMPISFND